MASVKLVEAHRRDHYSGINSVHYFLVVDGTPVSYVKILENYYNLPLTLADIETREEYRNHGWGAIILEKVAEKYGVEKVPHGGSYTEDGYFFIQKHLDRSAASEPASISVEAMTFVANWDEMQPKWS